MVFLTIEPVNQAEIHILSARDTRRPGPQTRASWVMMHGYIRGSMARDIHLALQNQPLTFDCCKVSFQFLNLLCLNYRASQDGLLTAWPWFIPRFPTYFFPSGVFSGRFFLASVQTAFALLTVAQLYQFFLKTFVRFLLVFLYFRFILHCTSELMIPSLTGSLTGTKLVMRAYLGKQAKMTCFSYSQM